MHPNGGVDNPHSFTFSPIHREIGNPDSEIVAMFALATAWDVSMLNLLPDNVKGMICVIENTCDQIVSYRIDGKVSRTRPRVALVCIKYRCEYRFLRHASE